MPPERPDPGDPRACEPGRATKREAEYRRSPAAGLLPGCGSGRRSRPRSLFSAAAPAAPRDLLCAVSSGSPTAALGHARAAGTASRPGRPADAWGRLGRVEIQHVLPLADEVGTDGRDQPLLNLPRLELDFSSGSAEPSHRRSLRPARRSASIRMVHRSWPVGGSLQASVIRNASPRASSFGSAPGRGRSERAPSSPSVE